MYSDSLLPEWDGALPENSVQRDSPIPGVPSSILGASQAALYRDSVISCHIDVQIVHQPETHVWALQSRAALSFQPESDH